MAEAGEQRPGSAAAHGGPFTEGGDRVCEGVLAVGDTHDLAMAFGIGLGPKHVRE